MSRRLLLPLALFGAALALGADEPTEPPLPPRAKLGELRAERTKWVGREVRLVLQVERELETWNPWVTRFGPEDFRALSVWSDEAKLWQATDFVDTTPHVFVRRGTLLDRMLRAPKRYQRLEVRAVVRSVFLDEPWIELLEVRTLPEHVSDGTILHATRAVELLGEGHFALAEGELERARAGRLPAHVDVELARLSSLCRARQRSDG